MQKSLNSSLSQLSEAIRYKDVSDDAIAIISNVISDSLLVMKRYIEISFSTTIYRIVSYRIIKKDIHDFFHISRYLRS